MKRLFLLLFPAILLFSCSKKDQLPLIETITKGDKWGIRIGSSYADVYNRLQQLNNEKDLSSVAVVYRQPFSSPQQVQYLLPYYDAVTLMDTSVVIDRALIQFSGDKVAHISAGGALPEEMDQWPAALPSETAILKNDLVNNIYTKLLAIYKIPAYSQLKIILPDKPLNKPFDPDMEKYAEWGFSITTDVKPGVKGNSIVRLYFKDGKLNKILHQYNENEVYN
ncbi:hypothetical protein [Chitinophaga sp. OAE865]|uniref:hypothetical protein n=1 Tax=Chitinophaga sp. OAE865 TaxID=2817898 RepID=UPI001AE6B749